MKDAAAGVIVIDIVEWSDREGRERGRIHHMQFLMSVVVAVERTAGSDCDNSCVPPFFASISGHSSTTVSRRRLLRHHTDREGPREALRAWPECGPCGIGVELKAWPQPNLDRDSPAVTARTSPSRCVSQHHNPAACNPSAVHLLRVPSCCATRLLNSHLLAEPSHANRASRSASLHNANLPKEDTLSTVDSMMPP